MYLVRFGFNSYRNMPSSLHASNKKINLRVTPAEYTITLRHRYSENTLTMPNSQSPLVGSEDIGDIELSDAPPFGDSDIEEELKASSNGASKSIVTDKLPPKIEDMFDDDDDDTYGMSDGDDAKLFVETEAAMKFVPIGPKLS